MLTQLADVCLHRRYSVLSGLQAAARGAACCPGRRKKQMDTIVTLGLVLKETRYKESDRIITLLTPGLV